MGHSEDVELQGRGMGQTAREPPKPVAIRAFADHKMAYLNFLDNRQRLAKVLKRAADDDAAGRWRPDKEALQESVRCDVLRLRLACLNCTYRTVVGMALSQVAHALPAYGARNLFTTLPINNVTSSDSCCAFERVRAYAAACSEFLWFTRSIC